MSEKVRSQRKQQPLVAGGKSDWIEILRKPELSQQEKIQMTKFKAEAME